MRRRGRPASAEELDAACENERTVCLCRVRSVDAVVELGDPGRVSGLVGATGACDATLELALGAELLGLQGQWQQAELAARGVLHAGSVDARAQLILARSCVAAGRVEDALAHARAAFGGGEDRAAGVLLSQLELRLGATLRAEEVLTRIGQKWAEHPDVLFARALIADARHEYGLARRRYLRVLALDASYADARLRLGLLTYAAGARGEAQHNLRKLTEVVGPHDPRVLQLESTLAGQVNGASQVPGVRPSSPASTGTGELGRP